MAATLQKNHDSTTLFHFNRPRLNKLFNEAVKYPLVVVCAGAGYGKTCAVHDFAEEYQATMAWIHLSERDNVGARFWENFAHSLIKVNMHLAEETAKLDFPDTKEKLHNYRTLLRNLVEVKSRIIVIDDFHCIEEPSVIRFLEECILRSMPQGTSVFLISRSTPNINIAGLVYRDQMFNMSESDLCFTESELAQYFRRMNILLRAGNIHEIMQDTEGWAFAINLIARSYQKAPGYGGYVRNAMKSNIFRLMETEIWDEVSGRLQNFLVRISLIDHLSVDLITQLAGEEEGLITELEKQNAYMRMDIYTNAYLIHPLFLEFLSTKQESLLEGQKLETYAIAGDWCVQNGFKIDAMSYYEKTGNYQAIVSILDTLPAQLPHDIAQYAAAIFDKAPADVYDRVNFFAEMHIRTYMCQGLWQKSLELVKYYKEKFIQLPEDDIIRKRTLARLYVCWSHLRSLMSTMDDIFDYYFSVEIANKCVFTSEDLDRFGPYYSGAWLNFAGSSRKGSPEEFIDLITHNWELLSRRLNKNPMFGEPELARGELEFYRGDTYSAVSHVELALKQARANKQFRLIHRVLFYTLRIAVSQGNYTLAEQALKETKTQLYENGYPHRFIDYDISLSWYYCFLGMPENVVDWLKEDFSPYSHAVFIENFGNQIKARYCYATENFSPLLSYIEEMKKRESFLFGRVEMLSMEACIHNIMKNKRKALAILFEAYETAEPNGILMPFIEMGKDMRTLSAAALKDPNVKIPKLWLEDVNRKAASYAKRRTHIIMEYKKANGLIDGIVLSPREAEVLADLSHGLSRVEIAAKRDFSINTVKVIINTLYAKVGTENLADLIRVAVEQKLI